MHRCTVSKLPENSVDVHGGSGLLPSHIDTGVVALRVVAIRKVLLVPRHLNFITD